MAFIVVAERFLCLPGGLPKGSEAHKSQINDRIEGGATVSPHDGLKEAEE